MAADGVLLAGVVALAAAAEVIAVAVEAVEEVSNQHNFFISCQIHQVDSQGLHRIVRSYPKRPGTRRGRAGKGDRAGDLRW